jgi:cell division protein ZapA (FtsZ GTPase activity inhibitor)
MSMKHIEVQILGKNFNFNVPKNIRTEDFMEIIDYVENKFSHIRKEAGDLDAFRLGLLAAINITEEFYAIKQENEKLRAVLSNIDSMLPPVDKETQLSIQFSP